MTICYCKKQITSFFMHLSGYWQWFHHSIVKVVCGSTATLTLLGWNSWSITGQMHKKTDVHLLGILSAQNLCNEGSLFPLPTSVTTLLSIKYKSISCHHPIIHKIQVHKLSGLFLQTRGSRPNFFLFLINKAISNKIPLLCKVNATYMNVIKKLWKFLYGQQGFYSYGSSIMCKKAF